MTDTEFIATLRLQRIPKIGDITAKKLIATCGSPSAIFFDKKEHLLQIEGIGSWTISGLWDIEYEAAAAAEWEYIIKNQIQPIYYQDSTYPSLLRNCPDGPILLFAKGCMDLGSQKIISVVGTRNMTRYGQEFCEKFIAELTEIDPVIVSGLAFGVDICAQRTAMEMGMQTIACLGHGLNQIYPRQHAREAQHMQSNGGCLTEFWSSSKPDREHFLQRNRIIAGMSHATVVVESASRGGSLVTADLAFGYDREVFSVPGRPTDPFSEGCNGLISSQKAQLITCAADFIHYMGWEEDSGKIIEQQTLFVPMGEEEEKIHTYLKAQGRQHMDTIAAVCKIPVNGLASTLLTMEMKGVVRPLPGKWFEAI